MSPPPPQQARKYLWPGWKPRGITILTIIARNCVIVQRYIFMADKMEADLREALLKCALGYEYEERTITAGKNGRPERVQVVKKHVPPDLQAIERIRYLQRVGEW